MKVDKFTNQFDESTQYKVPIDVKRTRLECIIYFNSFQNFDMDKMRNAEDIADLIDAIPHNRGFLRNGILFDGSFDNLVKNLDILQGSIKLILDSSKSYQLSLSNFICLTFNDVPLKKERKKE